jgi:3-hydroxyisobutyrate dehydrogenase
MAEAEKGGVTLNIIPVIARLMDNFIARGYGNNDWTVIGKDAV